MFEHEVGHRQKDWMGQMISSILGHCCEDPECGNYAIRTKETRAEVLKHISDILAETSTMRARMIVHLSDALTDPEVRAVCIEKLGEEGMGATLQYGAVDIIMQGVIRLAMHIQCASGQDYLKELHDTSLEILAKEMTVGMASISSKETTYTGSQSKN